MMKANFKSKRYLLLNSFDISMCVQNIEKEKRNMSLLEFQQYLNIDKYV